MRRVFGGAVLAVLALLVAGPAGAATRVGGFAAATTPDVKLGPLRLGIPRPAPGAVVFGAFKIRATSKAALASASKPYEIRLAPSSAHGDVLVTAVHTDRTKTAVTRTVLFLVANAPTRALSGLARTRDESYGAFLTLITTGVWVGDDAVFTEDDDSVFHSFQTAVAVDQVKPGDGGQPQRAQALAKLFESGTAWDPPATPASDPNLDTTWYDDGHSLGWKMHTKEVVNSWFDLAHDADVGPVIKQIEDQLAKDGPNGSASSPPPAGTGPGTCSGTGRTATQTLTGPTTGQEQDFFFTTTIPARCKLRSTPATTRWSAYLVNAADNSILACDEFDGAPPGEPACPGGTYAGTFGAVAIESLLTDPYQGQPPAGQTWRWQVRTFARKATTDTVQAFVAYKWDTPGG